MIKNIIFDIGQVLVTYDWEGYLREFGFSEEMNRTIAEAVFLNEDWRESDLGVLTREELADLFVQNAPHAERQIREVFAGAGRTVRERDYPAQWVESLKARGFHVYFLSNYPAWGYEDSREILDKFLSKMDGGVFSFEVHKLKPDAGIYRDLLEKYHLLPKECLFVDDRPENVEGAKALGMEGIVFTGYEEVSSSLSLLPFNSL